MQEPGSDIVIDWVTVCVRSSVCARHWFNTRSLIVVCSVRCWEKLPCPSCVPTIQCTGNLVFRLMGYCRAHHYLWLSNFFSLHNKHGFIVGLCMALRIKKLGWWPDAIRRLLYYKAQPVRQAQIRNQGHPLYKLVLGFCLRTAVN